MDPIKSAPNIVTATQKYLKFAIYLNRTTRTLTVISSIAG